MTERFKQITRLADLITAELTGEINDADLEELERWKAASAENLALYEQYRSQAFLEKKIRFIGQNSWEEAYRDFENETRKVKRRKRSLIFYRYAGMQRPSNPCGHISFSGAQVQRPLCGV